jgi:hypothetical protein
MIGEQAVITEGMWAGLVRTEPHIVSGWHHHGDYETSTYVISGLFAWNPAREVSRSARAVLVASCSCLKVLSIVMNPGDIESHIDVVRSGMGTAVINVDAQAPISPP